jgi:hypothetical protein
VEEDKEGEEIQAREEEEVWVQVVPVFVLRVETGCHIKEVSPATREHALNAEQE